MNSKKNNNKGRKSGVQPEPNGGGAFDDAFEKEAAEGFAMMGTHEEQEIAKKELDAQVQSELFGAPKKNNTFWFAAAGFMIIVGFAIFFIRDLKKEETIASYEPAVKPNIQSAPPTTPLPNQETVRAAEPLNNENFKPTSKKPTVTPLKEKEEEENKIEKKSEEHDLVLDEQPTITGASNAAPLMNNKAEADLASITKDAKQSEMIIASNDEGQSDKQKSSKTAAPQLTAPAAERMHINNVQVNDSTRLTNFAANTCSYKGGEKQLQKDVALLLQKQDVLYGFEALLTVDLEGKVQNVKLTKIYKLTEAQQEKIKAELKKLDQFIVNKISDKIKVAEYMLVFRP